MKKETTFQVTVNDASKTTYLDDDGTEITKAQAEEKAKALETNAPAVDDPPAPKKK